MKVRPRDRDALRDSEYRSAFVRVKVAHEYDVVGACFDFAHRAVDPTFADVRVAQDHDASSFAYCQCLRKGELLKFFCLRVFDVPWT